MLSSGAEVFERAFLDGLRPDPLLLVSEWADRHRRLSQNGSPEPGQWRTSRTPYLREIMDCLSPSSPVQEVVFKAGAQLGKTEGGCCWIGYIIDYAPGPAMMVQPTVDLAKRWSRQRFDPMVYETPRLSSKVADPKSRDSGNTMLSKEFPGGILIMTGANSAVGLRSMPVRYLFLDEIDGYPQDIDEEGDPVELAVAHPHIRPPENPEDIDADDCRPQPYRGQLPGQRPVPLPCSVPALRRAPVAEMAAVAVAQGRA